MKLQQAFKRKVADSWHIVWRSLRPDGSEDFSSNGVSFVYYGPLEPKSARRALDAYVKTQQTWAPDVYLIN